MELSGGSGFPRWRERYLITIPKQAWLEAAHISGKPIPEPRYRPVIYQAV
jgi:hypothetical protein